MSNHIKQQRKDPPRVEERGGSQELNVQMRKTTRRTNHVCAVRQSNTPMKVKHESIAPYL